MSAKQVNQQAARVKRLVKLWTPILGLESWDIVLEIDPKEIEDDEQYHRFMWLAETNSYPQYEWASIRFSAPSIAKITDNELEETVVHELNHVMVAEARIKDSDREEHVVTLLARAFLRASRQN